MDSTSGPTPPLRCPDLRSEAGLSSPTETCSVFQSPALILSLPSPNQWRLLKANRTKPSCFAVSPMTFPLSEKTLLLQSHLSQPLTYIKHDGQSAVPQCFPSACGLQPCERLTTVSLVSGSKSSPLRAQVTTDAVFSLKPYLTPLLTPWGHDVCISTLLFTCLSPGTPRLSSGP